MGTRVYQLAGGAPAPQGNQSWAVPQVLSDDLVLPWIPQRGSDPDFNAEFVDGTSPDFAALGWTVIDWNLGTPMTRRGEVCWQLPGMPQVAQYNSTVVGNRILVQAGANMFIYKTFPPGVYCFAARMGPSELEYYSVVGNDCKLWVYNSARNPVAPTRNAFMSGFVSTNVANVGRYEFRYTNSAGTQVYNMTNNIDRNSAVPDTWTVDLRGPRDVNGGSPAHAAWNTPGVRQLFAWQQGSLLDPTTARACGIQITTVNGQLNTAPSDLGFVWIDWIRRSAAVVP